MDEPKRQRRARFDAIKESHAHAWKDWDEQEDALLRSELDQGLGVAAIARAHGRPPGAVRSRIRQLGRR